MKKILSIVLFTAMILTMFVLPTSAAAWDGTSVSTSLKGEGTADKPFLVETAADLAFLAKDVNGGNSYAGKYITQTADIDLGGKEWTPIGMYVKDAEKPFSGVYDGKGFKVTGLSITKEVSTHAGLFGYVMSGSLETGIANITVEGKITVDAWASSNVGVGGIVGALAKEVTTYEANGYLINATSDVDITLTNCAGQPRVGGVAGYVFYGKVENVVNNGDVTVNGTATSRVGGVAGQTNRTAFINVVNNGNVTSDLPAAVSARAAGIVAVITRGGVSGYDVPAIYTTFENCINNGVVYAKSESTTFAAGIAADFYVNSGNWSKKDVCVKFTDCINNGAITAETTNAGVFPHAGGLGGYTSSGGDEIHAFGCVNTAEIKSLGGKQDRSGGMYGSVYSSSVVSAETFKIEKCISVGSVKGGCFSLKDAATALDTCVSDADAATIKAAVSAIEAKMAPSEAKIAGFDTAYKAPVVPEPPVTPETPDTPAVPTGDATILLAMIALVSLAGAVVAKKVSAR